MKDIRLVKIKTWEQMEQEFGLDKNDDIDCELSFLKVMEENMPKNRIIVLENKGWKGWTISDDMIEEEVNSENYPQYFI